MKLLPILNLTILITMLLIQIIKPQISSEQVDEILSEAKEKFNLPAVAVVCMNPKEILFSNIKGVRIIDTDQKVTINDYFHIGSCSKSVLAIITGKLIEEQKLKWNTKFFEVFPELKKIAQKEYHDITIEDLFLCKAGIKPYISLEEKLPGMTKEDTTSRYDFAKYLIQQNPSSEYIEGKFEFLYSNAGYSMITLVVEKITGLSYENLIEKYFNEDLGIETIIGFPNKIYPNQPWGHIFKSEQIEKYSPENEYEVPYLIKPAGDLSMSPINFAKYIQLNLSGLKNGNNFLSKETFNHIHFGYEGFSIGVGNGEMSGYKFSGMDGSTGTFFCRAILIPEENFAFVIMTNIGSGTGELEAVDWITMKIVKKHFNWWWKFWL